MSQLDNRNSSATKRARTDGNRREDDWRCPSCGNLNFAFRTTCNMRNCTQSRPSDHNSKPSVKPIQIPPAYSSSAGYMGVPSPMYLGGPAYGSSVFSGSSMLPPYNSPLSGGLGYRYDYNSRMSMGSPYGHLPFSGPSPYSGASALRTGGVYGMHPFLNRYELGLPVGHAVMGARPTAFVDDSSMKKSAENGRDGDWICPKCGNNNFSFRDVCNMRKCNTPKPRMQGSKPESDKGSKAKTPDGSWKCEKCGNINYPFRTKCNRQNCGAEKPAESSKPQGQASDEEEQ